MIKPLVKKKFLDHFYHEVKDHVLEDDRSRLNLHIIRILNNQFAIKPLMQELLNHMISFCLSKKEYKNLIEEERFGELAELAQERFRDYESNEGEFGELLLYCFLESHLEAPKLLTKMNLKTSHNDYVKGADGVHLLKLSENNYQIVFGESKMYKTFKEGLRKAFSSINSFINHKKNNIHFEINLVNTHFDQEIEDEQTYEEIKKIIFPSAQEDEINTDNAFGIFVGFNLELDSQIKRLSNSDFQNTVRGMVKDVVKKEYKYIESQIDKYELYGYTFYIYCIPFVDIEKVRKEAIKKLKGEG
ncbi:DUF1837 domain-containing protein [Bacillus siamensis]|uniref:HamA C-terminal domain-containing protein n=1 Tax=Bacillus TaxID=1386 RepID=UPI0007683BE1|nr:MULTISPECIES: DUF1837 domain-containing protein [Bacillus]AME06324.1 hypothetical protein AUL54_08165 [Bacillus sp. SDLI1]UUA84746.1 DUF1837 domain-containing protein [Bacillus siamensis]